MSLRSLLQVHRSSSDNVQSVVNLMTLISSLSSMLRSTPFHRESYSHLIVSVVHQYFQRCRDRFKGEPPGVFSDQRANPLAQIMLNLRRSYHW